MNLKLILTFFVVFFAQAQAQAQASPPRPMEFQAIAPATFVMGRPWIEKPAWYLKFWQTGFDPYRFTNQVATTISQVFEIQTTEVTQYEWFAVMGNNPAGFSKPVNCPEVGAYRDEQSGFKGCADYPVDSVSWEMAQKFIEKKNTQNPNYTYRLPTDAEFELAARGGTSTDYSFGSNVADLGDYAWFSANSGNQTHAVASKKANPFGLYDMAGNVWEWVQDVYRDDNQVPGGFDPLVVQASPTDAVGNGDRVLRGGGWYERAGELNSGTRSRKEPAGHDDQIGFRLVRVPRN